MRSPQPDSSKFVTAKELFKQGEIESNTRNWAKMFDQNINHRKMREEVVVVHPSSFTQLERKVDPRVTDLPSP